MTKYAHCYRIIKIATCKSDLCNNQFDSCKYRWIEINERTFTSYFSAYPFHRIILTICSENYQYKFSMNEWGWQSIFSEVLARGHLRYFFNKRFFQFFFFKTMTSNFQYYYNLVVVLPILICHFI